MAEHFYDTSAAVKHYRNELGTPTENTLDLEAQRGWFRFCLRKTLEVRSRMCNDNPHGLSDPPRCLRHPECPSMPECR